MRRGRRVRPEGFRRYHVQVRGRRTTVTLDKSLSDYLAAHLGAIAGDPEDFENPDAHYAVRQWMKREIDAAGAALPRLLSDWMYRRALVTVVRQDLIEAVIRW